MREGRKSEIGGKREREREEAEIDKIVSSSI